jgi:hypothetical protein
MVETFSHDENPPEPLRSVTSPLTTDVFFGMSVLVLCNSTFLSFLLHLLPCTRCGADSKTSVLFWLMSGFPDDAASAHTTLLGSKSVPPSRCTASCPLCACHLISNLC